MRTMNVVRSLGFAAALLLAPALHAQAGGTPFRAGQWGAEFEVSDDFESLGLVRFLSATRALAFDVQLANASSEVDGTQVETSGTAWGVSGAYRAYRGIGSGVAGHIAAGLRLDRTTTSNTNGAGATTETTNSAYGPFGEIGASWFVNPHLSLGAAYGLQYLITRGETETPGGTTETSGHAFGTAPLSFRISLYF